MFIRYMIEATLFIVLAILIQLSISNFYVDLNLMIEETNEIRKLRRENPESYMVDPDYI